MMADQTKIMLCCESCVDINPERCGHFRASDLSVTPDGRWLCDDCYDDDDELDRKKSKPLTQDAIMAAAKAVQP
jgi:hypothetical protein